MFNYATKSDLKNATDVNTSKFAKRADLGSLNSENDKLHIDKLAEPDVNKLKPVLVDLNKLSDVVDNEVLKNKSKLT